MFITAVRWPYDFSDKKHLVIFQPEISYPSIFYQICRLSNSTSGARIFEKTGASKLRWKSEFSKLTNFHESKLHLHSCLYPHLQSYSQRHNRTHAHTLSRIYAQTHTSTPIHRTSDHIRTYFPILTRIRLETHSHTDIHKPTHTLPQNSISTHSPGDKNMELDILRVTAGLCKKCEVECQEYHIESPTCHLLCKIFCATF